MKVIVQLNDILKINYTEVFTDATYILFVKVIDIVSEPWSLGLRELLNMPNNDYFQYTGKVIFPKSQINRELIFFDFSIIKNLGQLDLDELIEKYPEYLI